MLDHQLKAALVELEQVRLRRELKPLVANCLDFSSNDYLGLKHHPAMIAAAMEWTQRFGSGSGASRLAGGTRREYLAVEEKLAGFKKKEAALIVNSGFQLNATLLPALAQLLSPSFFADRLIHASLHHGIAASGIKQQRFRHNDLEHLEELLRKDSSRHKIILTESVFSMDGDHAPLQEMSKLAERYGAILYVDEAHATGVAGKEGRGLACDLAGDVIIMGTLGKALGSFGAYIAGSRALIDYCINKMTGFIYSTALPPACYGALDQALDLVPGMEDERAGLREKADRLRQGLAQRSISTGDSSSQIVPAILQSEERAMEASRHCLDRGIAVPAIRPPTVPPGLSRLRFSLRADHDEAAMASLLEAIAFL